MESVLSVLENVGRFLLLIRPADVVDVAIMAFVVYKLLGLMRSLDLNGRRCLGRRRFIRLVRHMDDPRYGFKQRKS